MLKFYTAGESHGRGLVGIIEGMPAGLVLNEEYINKELGRRQMGHGRGARMKIESDQIEIYSGVRNCITLGSPISFIIPNQDHKNWQEIMGAGVCNKINDRTVKRPRPGHADLPGAMKYDHTDMRNVLERASARETAARVAAGAFFKQLLAAFNIYIYSEVLAIGTVNYPGYGLNTENLSEFQAKVEASPVRCYSKEMEERMIDAINQAIEDGESLGGCFVAGAVGVPPGLGSHVSWNSKLDGKIAGILMSIPAIKGVEIGDGIKSSISLGSQVHDQIYYHQDQGLYRQSNRAGGIEGGISNGEILWARAYMKPIPTLMRPLSSVNTETWCAEKAVIERSDVCAVPAASIVGEAMMAYILAEAFLEKFSGDSIKEIEQSLSSYRTYLEKVWKWEKI
ncbi:chorismate synthase [hydrocarbon metagenome]|uniref:chorismate synthase n=1 Tax=hydrocarbon metagenome TaxID=938273 RepID=A0A0W8E8V6_9ZZZZ